MARQLELRPARPCRANGPHLCRQALTVMPHRVPNPESRIPSPEPRVPDPSWYKDAVIYEAHVRAFYDSNGDGIGDFPGLTQKLPYLHNLGVTCLWLLPFYPSPLRDDGYDIADYRSEER